MNQQKTNPSDVSLAQIANWQLAPEKRDVFKVDLPKLQRDFVSNFGSKA